MRERFGQNLYILFTSPCNPHRGALVLAGRWSWRSAKLAVHRPSAAVCAAERAAGGCATPCRGSAPQCNLSMSFGPSAAMVLVQVRARPALLNDRAAQNHRAGARRSAQSLRVDVHGGLTTVSASRSFLAAAPPDPSSCARRGRWASADAAGPLHDPTRRAGLGCSSSKSKSARRAVTPGVSGVERAPAAGLHGTCMSTTRCLAMWLS